MCVMNPEQKSTKLNTRKLSPKIQIPPKGLKWLENGQQKLQMCVVDLDVTAVKISNRAKNYKVTISKSFVSHAKNAIQPFQAK